MYNRQIGYSFGKLSVPILSAIRYFTSESRKGPVSNRDACVVNMHRAARMLLRGAHVPSTAFADLSASLEYSIATFSALRNAAEPLSVSSFSALSSLSVGDDELRRRRRRRTRAEEPKRRDRGETPDSIPSCVDYRAMSHARDMTNAWWSFQTWRTFAAQSARGMPKGAYMPPAAVPAMGGALKVALVSSNVIAEPYRGEPAKLPLSSWVTMAGWKARWNRWINSAKSIYTLAKIRRNLKEFSMPKFKEEAIETYERVCEALASGNRTALRHLVAPVIFTDMKRQLKVREEGGWKRVEWKMSIKPEMHTTEVVQGRMIAADPKNDDTAFAQLTVKFQSRQIFAAYDAKSRLVAGNAVEDVEVIDHWVFERPLRDKRGKWRVAGRLTVPITKTS